MGETAAGKEKIDRSQDRKAEWISKRIAEADRKEGEEKNENGEPNAKKSRMQDPDVAEETPIDVDPDGDRPEALATAVDGDAVAMRGVGPTAGRVRGPMLDARGLPWRRGPWTEMWLR